MQKQNNVSIPLFVDTSRAASRLSALSLSLHYFTLPQLDHPAFRSDCLVFPHEVTLSADWPHILVKLAKKGTSFVVEGTALTTSQIVALVKDGANQVLQEQDSDEQWRWAIEQTINHSRSLALLYQHNSGNSIFTGSSESIRDLSEQIRYLASVDVSVLIEGESGTGKERVAKGLHESRKDRPFVALNCAAIPAELLETELFGATKGAYTGAYANRTGLVRDADGGTLFLDEIGELPLAMQAKLLRFLETRTARPVGSGKEYRVDVRVVSATNRDLLTECKEKRFREDLFYRLAEVRLAMPPLRERREDIPALVRELLEESGSRYGKYFESVENDLIEAWKRYSWPGNIRELKHTIEQIVIFHHGPVVRSAWWHPSESSPHPDKQPDHATMPAIQTAHSLPHRRGKIELAKSLCAESGGDYFWVASQLGIHPTTLFRWRKRHGF